MSRESDKRFVRGIVWIMMLMTLVSVILVGHIASKDTQRSESTSVMSEKHSLSSADPVASGKPDLKQIDRDSMQESYRQFYDLSGAYVSRHQMYKDKFWLPAVMPLPQSKSDFDRVTDWIGKAKAWRERVQALMSRYRGVDEMTRKIHAVYPDFMISEFEDGHAKSWHEGDLNKIRETGKLMELCMVSEQQYRMYRQPSAIFYRADWGAMIAVAVEIPDAFLVAFMYHELGHAYKHQIEHAASASVATKNDEWVGEEIEMHEVEYHVLDAASDGKLGLLYDTIHRRAKLGTFAKTIGAVIPNDLVEFDRIFGTSEAGPILASSYIAQFYLGLGIEVINRYSTIEEWRQQKIDLYRWISSAN